MTNDNSSNNSIELDITGITENLTMQLHNTGDQMISARLRQDKCWEEYETSLVVKHLQAGEVFVDVGANIGYYTLVASACVGEKGKVIAYEPDADNFHLLQTNIILNDLTQAQIFPLALYDKNTEGKLFLSADNFGDHRIYASPENRESHVITLVHGGEHLGSISKRIDFLKIDTQGAEFFVVNGLKDIIKDNRAHLRMILEFCPYGIRNSGASGHDLITLLDSFTMQYHIIDHQQQCLIPAQSHHLSEWVERMANEPQNEGFINLFVTPAGGLPA